MCIRDSQRRVRGVSDKKMPSLDSTPQFLEDAAYYVGVWRRTQFDPASWPLCLSSTNGAACLDRFDADSGNLWRVVQHEQNSYMLMCVDGGEERFLGPDLRMKRNKDAAVVWSATCAPAFRGGPYDTSVQLHNDKGQLLCSKDSTKQIALLTPEEADEQDANGCFLWNNTWECSPDSESKEEDEFLNRYATVPSFE
eukprot:TRINITY_DN20876_c0_g1_i1.p2 TRINITY_DN20876_c0_g1~~TRINITY_DN20876_c0_g1_i1.p2  ORF type:complete len:196 (+),score=53.88 TRINITY_DN20876_c0_g1_i1:164-751(+)